MNITKPSKLNSKWYEIGKAKADAWEAERVAGTLGDRLWGFDKQGRPRQKNK